MGIWVIIYVAKVIPENITKLSYMISNYAPMVNVVLNEQHLYQLHEAGYQNYGD